MVAKKRATRIANHREWAGPRPFSVAHVVNVRISLKDFKADTTLRLTMLKMRPPGKAYPTTEGFEPLGDIWSFRGRPLIPSFTYFEGVGVFSFAATCPSVTLNFSRSAWISALTFVSAEVFSP